MTTHTYSVCKLSISQCIWIVTIFYSVYFETSSAETVRLKRFAGSPGFGKRHDFSIDSYPIFRRFSNTVFGKSTNNRFGKINNDIHHFPEDNFPFSIESHKRSDNERFLAGTGFGKKNANGERFKDTKNEWL